jgi:hypothetical protein
MPSAQTTEEAFDHTMAITPRGVFFAIRHACARAGGSPAPRRRDGAADASTAIYSASKAAIEQRLTVVLEVAEQALEGHPNRSTQRVF